MLRSSLLALSLLLAVTASARSQAPDVDPGLREALARESRAVACITLRLPRPAASAPGERDFRRTARLPLAARRRQCAAAHAAFSAGMPRAGFRFLRRYRNSA